MHNSKEHGSHQRTNRVEQRARSMQEGARSVWQETFAALLLKPWVMPRTRLTFFPLETVMFPLPSLASTELRYSVEEGLDTAMVVLPVCTLSCSAAFLAALQIFT